MLLPRKIFFLATLCDVIKLINIYYQVYFSKVYRFRLTSAMSFYHKIYRREHYFEVIFFFHFEFQSLLLII